MHCRKLFLGTLLTLVGLLTSSCAAVGMPSQASTATVVSSGATGPTKPAPTSTAASATSKSLGDQAKYGGTLSRGNITDPLHLDIQQGTSIDMQLALANVYNGLVRFDRVDVNKVVPDLAERWEVSPDGKVFTFYVHQGVRWHDGQPFSSEDVRFSLERMAFWKDFKIVSPRGGQSLSAMEKVEIPDRNTVKVILKYPSGSFLNNIASGWTLILPKHVIQAKGDMKKDAVGTGAFKWKAWNPGVSQELVKNNDYFAKALPYLDGITIYPIKDDATRFAAFRTGRVKMTAIGSQALTHPQSETVRKEMADKAVVTNHAAGMRYLFLMPFNKKPWNDLRVRQALDLAFDRKAAIAINSGVGTLGGPMYPKGAWGVTEEEMAQRPGYRQPKEADVAEAKRLMADAGYPQGFRTKMLTRSGGPLERQGTVAKEQLAKIGIDVELEVKDTGSFLERLDRHDFDLAQYTPADSIDDPDIAFSFYVTGGARNYGSLSDKKIDELFGKQAAMLDGKERKAAVLEIQRKVLDLAVYPVVFWDAYNFGFWKEVRGYTPGFGPFSHNSLDEVWLAK